MILLGFPLMVNMTTEVRELGDFDRAASNLNRSFSNIQPPFGVWLETPTGGTPNFITGVDWSLTSPITWMMDCMCNQCFLTVHPS